MHPAKSVILFTTASGAGYGLIALATLFALLGLLPAQPMLGLVLYGLGLGAVTVGLLSSTFHLGHPERAWRALSQWRSSWLSREGVMAIVTYPPAGLFALAWVLGMDLTSPALQILGWLTVLCCALTIFTTSMIYASLKTIHAWCNVYVPLSYLVLGAATGAVVLAALAHGFGVGVPGIDAVALVLIVVALGLKLAYWRYIDTTRSPSTAETATGLGGLGKVRLLEAPHSQANYLMQEMGFRIARKHAQSLRQIALIAGLVAPAALLALGLALPALPALWIVAPAAVLTGIGVVVERWLFFAEARHTVMLYYGADTA
jgi:DMSO reductase anchor subunit